MSRSCTGVLLLGLWLGGFIAPALGADLAIDLPIAPKKPLHGLFLSVTSDWPPGMGYRPVRVVATPATPGPLPADRTLRIELTLREGYDGNSYTTVGFLELPEGSLGGSMVLLVPNTEESYRRWNLEVYEDGLRLGELCGVDDGGVNVDANNLKALFISKFTVRPQGGPVAGTAEARLLDILATSPEVEDSGLPPGAPTNNRKPDLLPAQWAPSELPDQWLAYSSLDLVTISWTNLQQLATLEPAKFEALRHWVHTGGTILVFGLGGEESSTAEASPLTQLQPTAEIENLAELDRAYQDRFALDVQRFGLGRVILLGSDLNADLPLNVGGALQLTALEQKYRALGRFGAAEITNGIDQFRFLIPGVGVGLVPVGAFLALISLFVVIIGPVNYVLLRRAGRMHFFPLTVAAAALLVTGGLIGYALIHDGLAVRARVRTYTLLDSRAGLATTLSRQAYYAGLTPSGGLKYPDDAAVFPVRVDELEPVRFHELAWLDGTQQLRRGYLGARSTTQFLVTQTGPMGRTLRVKPAHGERGAPAVENQLGGAVLALSLCDGQGQYFHAEGIAAGETRALEASAAAKISQALAALIHEEMHQPLPVDQATWNDVEMSQYRSYRYRQNQLSGDRGELLADRLLELSNSACRLPPRSFVAVVEEAPAVALGDARSRQEGSFHVVEGRW